MLKYIIKAYNALDRLVHSKKGQKFFFINDVIHPCLVLGIMWPTGILKWLWTIGAKEITILLVLSALYALYNAQKYYSKNYRY